MSTAMVGSKSQGKFQHKLSVKLSSKKKIKIFEGVKSYTNIQKKTISFKIVIMERKRPYQVLLESEMQRVALLDPDWHRSARDREM